MASSSPSSPKRPRMAEAPQPAREDELMSLPPEILDIILARIPFEKLVRTCCLSRAWRRRWRSVPNADIRFDWSSPAVPPARALWRCAAPVRGFRACVRGHQFYRPARWLLALARRGVRELAFECESPHVHRPYCLLGPALFSCAALVGLHLQNCDMPPAPRGFVGFPSLVSLTLCHVALPFKRGGAQVERLIAAAPCLAELKLDEVDTQPFEWSIRAPSLRVLKIVMPKDNGCRIPEELRLLEEAYINIDCFITSTQDFLDTFRRIITVKKLSFDTHWFYTNPLEGIPWKYENLREAHLTINFGKHPSIMSLFSLLRCAPYIEDLSIEASQWSSIGEPDEIDEDFLNSEISDNLFSSLKYVSLSGIMLPLIVLVYFSIATAVTRLDASGRRATVVAQA
ncbi:hypothetical protein E2562_009172 [Oryza meyeriana var. granulata]|uniref:Uncharacterized protein n=1 Tax=Oryza meyeriana var. granulata TaxID=110450 RepID=A0A6G1CEQ7_9ORYZ|nr:hypothetical protein E2562_009172 [Oryza meyeriana var. granulata]